MPSKKSREETVSLGKSTECICPKCGGVHKMWLYWSGAATPRKFCVKCKQTTEGFEDLDEFNRLAFPRPSHAEVAG